MKILAPIRFFLIVFLFSNLCCAETANTVIPSPVGTPVITAVIPNSAPVEVPQNKLVAVADASAPPTWAQEIITVAEKLPVVGPYLTKALVYLGILSSIITVLVGTILTILASLAGVFNASGLTEAAAAVVKFRDGPIMYWLKFLSMFNAQKATPPPAPMPPPAIS